MTAQFRDHKSLTFAYLDLVNAGFAEEQMSADFGVEPNAESVPGVHVGLLERLHRLAAKARARAAAPRHAPRHNEEEKADLTFETGERADEAEAIVARHGGIVSA